MAAAFQHEEIAPVPRGYRVRTKRQGDHEIRLAVPPGPRRKGAAVLVEILHPRGENPSCHFVSLSERPKNPSSVYSMAVSLGYPYLRGEGRVAADGRTWLSRVTKNADGSGEAMFIGWDSATRKWIIEKANPEDLGKTGGLHIKYSPVNQGYFLMWHGTVLRVFSTKAEAKEEMEYLLRQTKRNPAGKVRVFFDKGLGGRFVATVFHSQYGNFFASGETKEEARAKLKERVAHAEAVKSHRNPDDPELDAAADLYREFHGRSPKEVLELQESAEVRGEYTALGPPVELRFEAPNGNEVKIKFKEDDEVKVASSPDGKQIYFLGGNQDITDSLSLFGGDTGKDFIDLGYAIFLSYDASKWQTGFTPVIWEHTLGEESGIRPRGFFDNLRKRIYFTGGNYRVERPGIVD